MTDNVLFEYKDYPNGVTITLNGLIIKRTYTGDFFVFVEDEKKQAKAIVLIDCIFNTRHVYVDGKLRIEILSPSNTEAGFKILFSALSLANYSIVSVEPLEMQQFVDMISNRATRDGGVSLVNASGDNNRDVIGITLLLSEGEFRITLSMRYFPGEDLQMDYVYNKSVGTPNAQSVISDLRKQILSFGTLYDQMYKLLGGGGRTILMTSFPPNVPGNQEGVMDSDFFVEFVMDRPYNLTAYLNTLLSKDAVPRFKLETVCAWCASPYPTVVCGNACGTASYCGQECADKDFERHSIKCCGILL